MMNSGDSFSSIISLILTILSLFITVFLAFKTNNIEKKLGFKDFNYKRYQSLNTILIIYKLDDLEKLKIQQSNKYNHGFAETIIDGSGLSSESAEKIHEIIKNDDILGQEFIEKFYIIYFEYNEKLAYKTFPYYEGMYECEYDEETGRFTNWDSADFKHKIWGSGAAHGFLSEVKFFLFDEDNLLKKYVENEFNKVNDEISYKTSEKSELKEYIREKLSNLKS